MPILDSHSLDFWSHSSEQTVRFGARLGELLQPGDVITLSGELGAGKTTFIGGLSRGWGSPHSRVISTGGPSPGRMRV